MPSAKQHLEKVVNDLTTIRNNWLKSEEFDKTMYFPKLVMISRLINPTTLYVFIQHLFKMYAFTVMKEEIGKTGSSLLYKGKMSDWLH